MSQTNEGIKMESKKQSAQELKDLAVTMKLIEHYHACVKRVEELKKSKWVGNVYYADFRSEKNV